MKKSRSMIYMLNFKDITNADIKALAKLYVETFNAAPWNEEWTQETAEKRLYQMINVESFYGFGVYSDEELSGLILGCFEQYYDGVNFYLREFCVKNSLRGQGLGTEILNTFEQKLSDMNIKEIYLNTTKNSSAERFYNKQSYNTHEHLTLMVKQFN